MALVLKKIVSLYFYFNDECSDPRTKDWFLISGPIPILMLLAAYLYVVLNAGPKFMAHRKPYQIDKIVMMYNLFQVIACAFLFEESMRLGYIFGNYSLVCQPMDYSDSPEAIAIARRVHWYFLLKVADLLDTIFMVMRKKQNQVSFLHVYHHTGMTVLVWVAVKFLAGGNGVFMGVVNTFVHVVMYFYYFLTCISPEYKKNIWWKKYITQLQILQFGLVFLHWVLLGLQPNCPYPKFPLFFIVPQNLFMFVLFLDFYRKTYMKKTATANGKSLDDKKQDLMSSNGYQLLNENNNLVNGPNYETKASEKVYEDEITGEQEEESDEDLPDGSQR